MLNLGTVALILVMGSLSVAFPKKALHVIKPPELHIVISLEQRISNFGLAILVCLWAYDGWNGLNYATGSLENPLRTLPRCIGYGVSFIVIIFIAVNIAYLGALDSDVVRASPVVAITLGEHVLGRLGRALVALAISVSCIGACNGSILTGAQIYYRAASDNLWPMWFRKCSQRTGAPIAALCSQCIWTCVAVAFGGMKVMIQYFSFCQFLFYGLAIICLFRLREKMRGNDDPRENDSTVVVGYRTPLYPLLPCTFLCITAIVVLNAVIAAPMPSAVALAFISISLPVSFLCGCAPDEAEATAAEFVHEPLYMMTVCSVDKLEEFSYGSGI
jgi:amino acid transporter